MSSLTASSPTLWSELDLSLTPTPLPFERELEDISEDSAAVFEIASSPLGEEDRR